MFYNTASYYGQEILIAPGDPVRHEKSALEAVIKRRDIINFWQTPGDVVVDGDKFGTVDFTKVRPAVDGEDAPQPLAGATFAVYAVDAGDNRIVAVNKDGVRLENLVSNEDGKLCAAGSAQPVSLCPEGHRSLWRRLAPEGCRRRCAGGNRGCRGVHPWRGCGGEYAEGGWARPHADARSGPHAGA